MRRLLIPSVDSWFGFPNQEFINNPTMHLNYIQRCRVCGSAKLKPVINLGLQHLQGSFVKLGQDMPPNRRIPMELVRCDPEQEQDGCGLLQMAHSVPPQILYSTYWYRSGTNQTMTEHLKGIADEAVKLQDSPDPAAVLDIGCNDLTLLKQFPDNWTRVGIDPSNISRNAPPEGNIRVIPDLFPSLLLADPFPDTEFDVVTSIAMFYDLEEPVEFARSVRHVLAGDGVWILEMSYMPLMLAKNSYDTICHEHLEYYSLAVIERIMKRAGLKVFRLGINGINGGSLRCYICQDQFDPDVKPNWTEALNRIRESEFDMELDTDKPYVNFQGRIEKHRDDLMRLLRKLKKQGKSIHVYGASTKGNTLLQWCGIDSQIIDCAADRNPDKNQALTLGTCIQIVTEEESRARNPDYYLVLPWHFKTEFLDREKYEFHRLGRKTPGFIFPLPSLEVIEPE